MWKSSRKFTICFRMSTAIQPAYLLILLSTSPKICSTLIKDSYHPSNSALRTDKSDGDEEKSFFGDIRDNGQVSIPMVPKLINSA